MDRKRGDSAAAGDFTADSLDLVSVHSISYRRLMSMLLAIINLVNLDKYIQLPYFTVAPFFFTFLVAAFPHETAKLRGAPASIPAKLRLVDSPG